MLKAKEADRIRLCSVPESLPRLLRVARRSVRRHTRERATEVDRGKAAPAQDRLGCHVSTEKVSQGGLEVVYDVRD